MFSPIWFWVASLVLGHRKIARLPSDVIQKVMRLQWRHNGRDGVPNTSLTIVYSTVYTGADQRKHQSSASLAFVWGIHRGPVNSPHKWPVTRKMFPFDDVIMWFCVASHILRHRNIAQWRHPEGYEYNRFEPNHNQTKQSVNRVHISRTPLLTLITFNPDRDK